MRGGRARQAAQVLKSVPASGVPQVAQPASPRNSTCFQQSAQKLCTSATITPQPAHRGGSAKSRISRAALAIRVTTIGRLSLASCRRTSMAMAADLFDMKLRALRRDRAQRTGAELFLYERAFDDCLDRV